MKIKKITFKISIPLTGLAKGKNFTIELNDDANIVQGLAMIDNYIFEHPEESIFPIFKNYIHNYLQLVWNPEINKIYEDIGLSAYGPDEHGNLRKFMPLRDDIEFNLYPNSVIDIQPDSGC
ncbi:MAG TPA: hypothetical protein VMV43_01765 [Candidatus Nanopelagicaceae bacterium]|nr:hypothetical protein [Candidatus Nanopelagicaceae bacterium]